MNQSNINEDELQKAIDDITRDSVNEGVAPAPAPTAAMNDAVAANSVVNPGVAAVPGAPMEAPVVPGAASADAAVINNNGVPEGMMDGGFTDPSGMVGEGDGGAVVPDLATPPVSPDVPAMPAMPGADNEEKNVGGENDQRMEMATGGDGISEIKVKILRDLAPILKNMKINADQKFRIYCDMIVDLKDTSVVGDAYEAAKQIGDETARGEALLKLMEIID